VPDKPKKRRRLIAVLVVLACIPVSFYLGKIPGRLAVADLCARDGGLTINESTYTPGYVNLATSQECWECIREIAGRKFDWVVFELRDGDGYDPEGNAGFYRFELSDGGDPRCMAWDSGALGDVKRIRQEFDLTPSACIAATYIGSMPQSFTFEDNRTQLDLGWFNPLSAREVVISDSISGHVLARHREYSYTASITRIMDEGAGIGYPDAQCASSASGPFVGAKLRQDVLRDASKRKQRTNLQTPGTRQ
jgi:hypothetical protein